MFFKLFSTVVASCVLVQALPVLLNTEGVIPVVDKLIDNVTGDSQGVVPVADKLIDDTVATPKELTAAQSTLGADKVKAAGSDSDKATNNIKINNEVIARPYYKRNPRRYRNRDVGAYDERYYDSGEALGIEDDDYVDGSEAFFIDGNDNVEDGFE